MSCSDCPSFTDGKCCHESIKCRALISESVSSIDPMIDWTTADFALEQSAAQTKQQGLRAVNHQTIDDEVNRKQSANSEFWHRVINVMTLIAIAIVVYTLIHFAGLI